jgi:hypothetical protein
MAVTLADFRTQFPEFGRLVDSHVAAHLNAAITVTASDIGDVYEQVVFWRTADSLARQQWGYNANLKNPSQQTSYGVHLRELLESNPLRGMVISDAANQVP